MDPPHRSTTHLSRPGDCIRVPLDQQWVNLGPLDAYGSAKIFMNGGSVRNISVYDDSVGEVRGGSPTEYLFAHDDASLIVYGNSFAIDGSPVPDSEREDRH